MQEITRQRLDAIAAMPRTSAPTLGRKCGKGWVGIKIKGKAKCRRAEAVRRIRAAKNRERIKQGKHVAEHLGENVAAWGVGKVVGGAIAQVGIRHGLEPSFSKQIAESGVQALTATLIHARNKKNRNAQELGTYFIAQAGAAFFGKMAHSGVDDAIAGGDETVRAIASAAAGKGTGIATVASAKQALDQMVGRLSLVRKIRRDAARNETLTQSEREALFTLTLYGILEESRKRKLG